MNPGSGRGDSRRWRGITRSSRLQTSVAVATTVLAVVVAVAAAMAIDVAGALGRWLTSTEDSLANTAVGIVAGVSLALALLAFAWHRDAMAERRELERLSQVDPLTGLPNRSALPDALARVVASTRDGVHLAAVLFCDLDRFKQVNDTYGHEVGDELMVAVARRLETALAPGQHAVRHGGDEFVVVAGGLTNAVEADLLAGRIVRALETPFELGPDTVRISVSVGVAISDRNGGGADDLVYDADVAMYAAKADGPGSVRIFEPPMRARLSRANARPRLRAAIERDELGVRYEPIFSVEDGTLVAVRAELRWDGPGRTPVAGRELNSALDDTGLIVPAGTFALREVCGQLKRWRTAADGTGPQVVLPVSPRQLAQSGFRDLVARTLSDTGTSPARLCLIVGDRAVANEITDAWTMLRHVRALGVPIALEGFGAGTSSLADLRATRVDQLWIHGGLVAGLAPGSEDVAIIEHVIGLAHQLGIVVVADRVTSTTQLTMLRGLGCDRATGPFFGGDLGVEDVEALLARADAAQPRRVEEQPAGFPRLRAFG